MSARRPWLPDLAQLLPDDPGMPPGGGGLPPLPSPPVEKTLTQTEVAALVARETDRAERAFKAKLAEKHGLTGLDQLDALVASARAAEQAQMTEQQRATAAAEAEKTAAAAERSALASERLAMQTEQALIRSGVPLEVEHDGKRVPNPQLAGLARLVNVEPGADAAAIAAAVAEVKTTYPQLFAAPAAPPAGGTPPAIRPPRTPANANTEAGSSGRQALTEFGFVKAKPAS